MLDLGHVLRSDEYAFFCSSIDQRRFISVQRFCSLIFLLVLAAMLILVFVSTVCFICLKRFCGFGEVVCARRFENWFLH